jgi:CRISPR-associated protein Cas2
MAKQMFLVVAYDIASDRRRNRLVKLLKDYGERVNYSVFECRINKQTYPSLKDEISKIISRKKDSVLFYDLCLDCEGKRESVGIKKLVYEEPVIRV